MPMILYQRPALGPLCTLLGRLADDARMCHRPLPILETDMCTALLLEKMLMSELSPDIGLPRDHPERAFGVIAMFDGVKIKGRK